MINKITAIWLLFFTVYVYADEGMWLPNLLSEINIEEMQKRGLKLTAEDIYSINNSSLKDAVVIFNDGCTGALISDKGLLLTNYHCAYNFIQSHSNLENNYLEDGFWAKSLEEELPNADLNVTFLKKIKDVTEDVLLNVTDEMDYLIRDSIIQENISLIIAENTITNYYEAKIKSFYYGNKYYLFLYEVFKDVRLVGVPPSSIGKFGGDTDNWMWPRHTGDFALFRIYANNENKPSEYSKDNVPYKPEKYLTISLNGIDEGDFTWLIGYPGSTHKYLTSYEIEHLQEELLPININLRNIKLEILNEEMSNNQIINIQYASKYTSASNSFKKWQGILTGLKKYDVINKKQNIEEQFYKWEFTQNTLKEKYGNIYKDFKNINVKFFPCIEAKEIVEEAFFGIDIIKFIYANYYLITTINGNKNNKEKYIDKLKDNSEKFYRDYSSHVDQKLFVALIEAYFKQIEENSIPSFYRIKNEKIQGNIIKYSEYAFKKSIFINEEKFNDAFNNNFSKINKDPLFILTEDIIDLYNERIIPDYLNFEEELDNIYRLYVKGLQEMQIDSIFYPDANFTMRVAYGNVKGYSPRDAVEYDYFTTLDGIIAKHDPTIPDYTVPEKLFNLYKNNDFGGYNQNDTMRVCFIATNHTSSGNSGSPVLDVNGNLIGINFDRCWEGAMSDYFYDSELCRNIVLDIRYALFIIDKFAGAGYLLEEMNIIK
ncbi:MAG: S46 family peptidase [Bacteroidales bacterium]|nr:S46 family peptidase [Bacteroidales bacterium]